MIEAAEGGSTLQAPAVWWWCGAAVMSIVYLLLSSAIGARTTLGRVAAERLASLQGSGDDLRPGTRPRIVVDTVRQLALAFAVIAAAMLPLPGQPLVPPLVTALALTITARVIEAALAPRRPERILRYSVPVVGLLDRVIGPLAAPLARGFSRLVARHRRRSADDRPLVAEEMREEQLEEMIRDSEREGLLERAQGDLMREIVETGGTTVREVMTPRSDIDAVPAESTKQQMIDAFVASRHSRLPVFDGSLDRIIGVVALRDLLQHIVDPSARVHARDVVRPVKISPGSKKVLGLLRELQDAQQQMAVVVDEYGGTAGLVTLEDLIEEIVGEIRDEHEVAVEEFESDGRGGFIVSGLMAVEDLGESLGRQIEDDGVGTVGGLVFSKLRRVPRVGDSVALAADLVGTVVRMRGRRVATVRVSLPSATSSARGAAGRPR